MKLSRIEPFAATPDASNDAELVAEELSQERAAAQPVEGSFEDTPLLDVTEEDSKGGIIRFSEFVKRQQEKHKKKKTGLHSKKKMVSQYFSKSSVALRAYDKQNINLADENKKAQYLKYDL